MKREEEIINAALEECAEQVLDCKWAFMHGAKWADEHPRKGLVDIEEVCNLLRKKVGNYFVFDLAEGTYCFYKEQLIKELYKSMEE